jgi:hypothetical protein
VTTYIGFSTISKTHKERFSSKDNQLLSNSRTLLCPSNNNVAFKITIELMIDHY